MNSRVNFLNKTTAVTLSPAQIEDVEKARAGDRIALIRVYKTVALIIREGRLVPEAYRDFTAAAFDGIAQALAAPDVRGGLVEAVAAGLPRGRPPKNTKRLQAVADAANDLARQYPGRPGKLTRKAYIEALAQAHGYKAESVERVANKQQ